MRLGKKQTALFPHCSSTRTGQNSTDKVTRSKQPGISEGGREDEQGSWTLTPAAGHRHGWPDRDNGGRTHRQWTQTPAAAPEAAVTRVSVSPPQQHTTAALPPTAPVPTPAAQPRLAHLPGVFGHPHPGSPEPSPLALSPHLTAASHSPCPVPGTPRPAHPAPLGLPTAYPQALHARSPGRWGTRPRPPHAAGPPPPPAPAPAPPFRTCSARPALTRKRPPSPSGLPASPATADTSAWQPWRQRVFPPAAPLSSHAAEGFPVKNRTLEKHTDYYVRFQAAVYLNIYLNFSQQW